MIIVVEPDDSLAAELTERIAERAQVVGTVESARAHLMHASDVHVVLVGQSVEPETAYRLAEQMRLERPTLSVILVRHRLDAHLLAEALRAGVREVVAPRDYAAVSGAVSRAQQFAEAMLERNALGENEASRRLGRIVTVFSAKGGCGKTTLATNLAVSLADGGRRKVCIVDLDLAFGDVAIALQIFPAHTIADAASAGSTLDADVVSSLLTEHSPGLSVLAAPVEPGTADTLSTSVISSVLHLLTTMADFVVVDTPPAFTDHVMAAFDQSDVIALLATLDIPALKNLKVTMETLDLLGNQRDRWRIVLNRADAKVGLSVSEVEKTLNAGISAQVPSSRAVPASINRGVPIVLDEPNHAVSQAIRSFGETEIIGGRRSRNFPAHLRQDRRSFLRRKVKS
jgi:pilus assembly protein CpaE